MRDILTVIAALVILLLTAALVAPPLIDWESHRDLIDRSIGRISGAKARTEGRIRVRLLPSPMIRVDKLRLGMGAPDGPSLAANVVRAEIALTPLLRGDIRLTQARVGRAEIRIPVAPDGRWTLPPDLIGNDGRTREWSIENLAVSQLLLTTQVPRTGRTDQFYAEGVRIEGQKLIGPWRVEGVTAGVPFRLATSELNPDKTVQLKLSGGGDAYPRFDVDAKLALNTGEAAQPTISGKAKLLFGPPAQVTVAGIPIPVTVDATFKSGNRRVELDTVAVEAGEGGASLRLTGNGNIGLDEPRIALRLEGRRLNADGFVLPSNGQDFLSRLRSWALPPVRVPIDLDLSIDSIGLAEDELSNATLQASILKGRVQVERLELTAPGETRVSVQGEADLKTGGGSGRVTLASTASDRFARYVERLGLRGPALAVLDGQPFEAATDVAIGLPMISFSNMQIKSGGTVLTGNLYYTAPEGKARGRLEAQIAVQALDLNRLPQVSSIFDATQNLDVGLTFDAHDVRAGNQAGVGRISARILSDGPALLVETLNIDDLAGANARVSGRILPDGSGRIAGKVTAKRAAPLVDLLGRFWIGGVSKLVPHFLREGELDLDVVTERAMPEPGSMELRLRTTLKGTAAGGAFEGEAFMADGATQNLNVWLATDNTGRWIGRPDMPALRRPSQVTLQGTRVGSGSFKVALSGDIGGVRLETNRPFVLSGGDDGVESGEVDIATHDIGPFLALLGEGAGVDPPVPLQGRIALGRERDASLLIISGQVAKNAVQARLAVRSRADISGNVMLDRLSIPWLMTALSLNAAPDSRTTSLWSTVRFGRRGSLVDGGQIAFKVARLELGRGLQGENASFNLNVTPEGMAIRDMDAGLGGGQLTGRITVTRQGALASVVGEGALRNVGLTALTGPSPFEARLSANLKFGSSGETFAGLISSLGGAGNLSLSEMRMANAAPGALERALQRLLQESDPLAQRRAEAVVLEELNRGPLTATSLMAPIAIVAGSLRLSPVVADGGQEVWQGAVSYDFKTLTLDARGALAGKMSPKGWVGSPPSINLAWRGPLANPTREIETGVLTNGLAAIVLQRELEKIEMFEADANERQRRQQRLQMDRQRERDLQAFEEAARQARLREEAERARVEAERARVEAERIKAQQRARAEAERRALSDNPIASPSSLPALPPPIDIKPPPQIQVRPGG